MLVNKGQGCSTSEYKYVDSCRQCNVCWNELGFPCYFVAECPKGHPYYIGDVSDAFYCRSVTSLKQDLYRGHQLYISVFMVYFYINVKSQVSLSPNNVLPSFLGLSGRSRDRIPYQATEYFSCSLHMLLFYFHCYPVSLPCSVAALWKWRFVLSVKWISVVPDTISLEEIPQLRGMYRYRYPFRVDLM